MDELRLVLVATALAHAEEGPHAAALALDAAHALAVEGAVELGEVDRGDRQRPRREDLRRKRVRHVPTF